MCQAKTINGLQEIQYFDSIDFLSTNKIRAIHEYVKNALKCNNVDLYSVPTAEQPVSYDIEIDELAEISPVITIICKSENSQQEDDVVSQLYQELLKLQSRFITQSEKMESRIMHISERLDNVENYILITIIRKHMSLFGFHLLQTAKLVCIAFSVYTSIQFYNE